MCSYKNLGVQASFDSLQGLSRFTDIFQVFLQDPRIIDSDETKLARQIKKFISYNHQFKFLVHGPYNTSLLYECKNFFDNSNNQGKSIISLYNFLSACDEFEVKYLIVHPGLFNGSPEDAKENLIHNIKLLNCMVTNVTICLENLSNKNSLSIQDLIDVASRFRNIGVCIDTNHAFGHGEDFLPHLSHEKVKVIHINSVSGNQKFGDGSDEHAKCPITRSRGLAPDKLRQIIFDFPDKIKIFEQYQKFAEQSYKFLF